MSLSLADELTIDELGRGYSSLSDEEAADDLNTSYRTRNRTSMTGDEVCQATDATEFAWIGSGHGNSGDDQGHLLSFCGRDSINPFASANVQFVTEIFAAGSTTLANRQAARVESITRATELGFGIVKVGHVQVARA